MARNPFEGNPEVLERARGLLGRLSGMTGWVVLLVVLGFYAAGGIYQVEPSEVGLVKRFGQFVGTTGPGLHYHLPAPIESVVIVNQKSVRTEEIGFRSQAGFSSTQFPSRDEEAQMLTGDFNIIRVETVIQYDVSSATTFAFEVADYRDILREAAQAIIREKIGTRIVDEALFEKRDEIADEVHTELQALLDRYGLGLRVLNVRFQEVTPPTTQVADAFDDVNSAIQDKESTIFGARRYENEQTPRAEGEAQKILNAGEGYKQSRILQAQGEVARFNSLLERYQLGEQVTKARLYLEAMEEILPSLKKIILPQGGGNVLNFLNIDQLLGEGRAP